MAAAAPATTAEAQEAADRADQAIVNGSAQRALDGAREVARGADSFLPFRGQTDVLLRPSAPLTYLPYYVFRVRNGVPFPAPDSVMKDVATVPRLFRMIQKAIDERVVHLDVRYGSYGVPRRIWINRAQLVIDEEDGAVTRRFRRL